MAAWRSGYNNAYDKAAQDVQRRKEAVAGGVEHAAAVAATIASLKAHAGLRVVALTRRVQTRAAVVAVRSSPSATVALCGEKTRRTTSIRCRAQRRPLRMCATR